MLKTFWLGSKATPSELADNCKLAPLRDRVAAQVLDFMIGIIGIWLLVAFITRRYSGIAISAGHFSISAGPLVTGCEGAIVVVVLYYLLMESLYGATIGKLLCRLAVKKEGKASCGVAAALIRTLIRPVDWVLGPIVIALSSKNQRLGDMIGCTVVTRQSDLLVAPENKGPGVTPAGWEVRTKAALIDLALLAASIIGIFYGTGALRVNPSVQMNLRPAIMLTICEWLFFYFVFCEALAGGTLGKLFSKLRVVQTNRCPCGFVEATTRTIWRVIDLLTLGLMPFLALRYGKSGRHPGEFLADTVVEEANTSRIVVLWTTLVFTSTTISIATYPFWRRIF